MNRHGRYSLCTLFGLLLLVSFALCDTEGTPLEEQKLPQHIDYIPTLRVVCASKAMESMASMVPMVNYGCRLQWTRPEEWHCVSV